MARATSPGSVVPPPRPLTRLSAPVALPAHTAARLRIEVTPTARPRASPPSSNRGTQWPFRACSSSAHRRKKAEPLPVICQPGPRLCGEIDDPRLGAFGGAPQVIRQLRLALRPTHGTRTRSRARCRARRSRTTTAVVGRRVSFSPRPSAVAAPPARKKGTSAPIEIASGAKVDVAAGAARPGPSARRRHPSSRRPFPSRAVCACAGGSASGSPCRSPAPAPRCAFRTVLSWLPATGRPEVVRVVLLRRGSSRGGRAGRSPGSSCARRGSRRRVRLITSRSRLSLARAGSASIKGRALELRPVRDRPLLVVLGGRADPMVRGAVERLLHRGRHARGHMAGRHLFALLQHGAGGEHRACAQPAALQHRGAHADDRALLHDAALELRGVADAGVPFDHRREVLGAVEDRVVLDVGARSDRDSSLRHRAARLRTKRSRRPRPRRPR